MKIVAVADLHGRLPKIPECDVLVIAGDICPEFMAGRYTYDTDFQRIKQMEWLRTVYRMWEDTVPSTFIFATPGNHDWVIKMPDECRTLLLIDEGIELYDGPKMVGRTPKALGTSTLTPFKRLYFTPWVSPIGNWNYQLSREQRRVRFQDIPTNLDLLVAHSPIYKIMDRSHDGEDCGCPELRQAVQNVKPKHFCFGHIHEGARLTLGYSSTVTQTITFGSTQVHHCTYFNSEKLQVFDI